MSTFAEQDNNPDFSKLDATITEWWKQNQIFEKSVKLREGKPDYIFYDGPPFMSGMPHYATLLSSLPKDLIPRYQTMKGKYVERLWGWDCHGLPIENKVEKELGLNGRKEILEYGLEPFIEKCYEWNRVGIENWRYYIDKIGRWADLDNAYRTMDQDYMESVWWAFKSIWQKGLVYKGKRTSMYSTDSSSPVSSFEVSMDSDNYRDTEDVAVTVKFKLTEDWQTKLQEKLTFSQPVFLLAWTTTPWTLPSNFALAVNPEAEYVAIKCEDEVYVVAKLRQEAVFAGKEVEVIGSLTPKDLEGATYEQLYKFLPGGANDFKVYLSEYVTTEDGSGVLHVAPAFGEADFDMGEKFELSSTPDIDDAGLMQVGPWKGTYIRKANPAITLDLKESGKLFKEEKYMHRLPYYRYANPLIYKVQEAYFVNVQKLKQELIKTNDDINWVPSHFKDGRFLNVLETAPDWSISRTRFWGTAMPIWQNAAGEQIVVGNRDELLYYVNNSENDLRMHKVVLELDETAGEPDEQIKAFLATQEETLSVKAPQATLSRLRHEMFGETEEESKVKLLHAGEQRAYYLLNGKALDMHRPYIDAIFFQMNGVRYDRILETLDVWMDSGSMPFAQFHYPFANKEKFEKSFPGDFVAEYTGQIRAWFNVLHVLSNALFEKPAFKNVLVTGVLAGTDGRKMSKSFNNYPDPKETLEKYGAEALRLYFLSSPLMNGNDMDFSEEDMRMQVREFLIPVWNIFKYLTTYANIHNWKPRKEMAYNGRNETADEYPWFHIPFETVENELDAWVLVSLQKTIAEVTAKMDAYEVPAAVRTMSAFINDVSKWYIRRSRSRFANGDNAALETLYYVLVEFIKLAAPLIPFTTEHIYQELVFKVLDDAQESVHLCDYPEVDADFLSQHEDVLPNMSIVRAVCELGQTTRANEGIKVRQPLGKLEVSFTLEDNAQGVDLSPWMQDLIAEELNVLEVTEVPTISESETVIKSEDKGAGVKVGLETKLSPELEKAGLLREIIRAIQALRKTSGMQMGEKVAITYSTDDAKLSELIAAETEAIKQAVSAIEIVPGEGESTAKINEFTLQLGLKKA